MRGIASQYSGQKAKNDVSSGAGDGVMADEPHDRDATSGEGEYPQRDFGSTGRS
jgi:hypothetical protein